MDIIDLHCDTLYKAAIDGISLDDRSSETKLNVNKNRHKLQCYAIWIPDSYSGEDAENLFVRSYKILRQECEKHGIDFIKPKDNLSEKFSTNVNSAYFTVENGLALNGKIENVKFLAECGVRMMTLTWNATNHIGDGAGVENARGITEFGKAVVREMERNDIIVDVSHASQNLFYDVADIAKRPFIASHSNSFSVTSHRRNLTDEQFEIIKNANGIVGINFHNAFLNENPENACVEDVLRHIEHFLSIGGEDTICFGSDFDGGILPKDIRNSGVYDIIYELMLKKNYKEWLIRKIFYGNALNFFENFDNRQNM